MTAEQRFDDEFACGLTALRYWERQPALIPLAMWWRGEDGRIYPIPQDDVSVR